MIDLEPGRLDEHGVAQMGQRPPHPSSQAKAPLAPRSSTVKHPLKAG
jgi:hypothetical protein